MASGSKQKQQQMTFWDAQAAQNINAAKQPTEAETALNQQNKDFLDWENKPGHNIGEAPGLADTIMLGHAAQARANKDRMGSGALQLADTGNGSPGIANLKRLNQDELAQNYGTNLEDSLAQRKAEVHGSVLPMSQLATSRNLGVADASSGMFHNWAGVQTGPSWWQVLLQNAQQAAQTYATMGAGG